MKKEKRVATQMPLSNLDNKNKTKNLNKNALQTITFNATNTLLKQSVLYLVVYRLFFF